jgi:hypothetical protein
MQRSRLQRDKDELDTVLCVWKTPIFRNFFRENPVQEFSRKWKKHVFFTTAAPPTADLWKIHYPTFAEDIFLSQCAKLQEN